MGVEHSFKDEDGPQVMRCPKCEVISTVKEQSAKPYVSLFAGYSGDYFICQNPKCDVERIYGTNAVMVSGK
jgi:hypothetical protein